MEQSQEPAEVEALIAAGEIERVQPDAELVGGLLALAERHLAATAAIADSDPGGAHTLLFMAAHRAVVAMAEAAGLRTTSGRRDLTAYEAVHVLLDPGRVQVLDAYARMHRRRDDLEYGLAIPEPITVDEVHECTASVREIVELAHQVAGGTL
ncbi:hypothetical protein [Mycolicibacterium conceptionense]|nr:hypothetical protein [Mycolicibacterium conceptionense]